jgi:hypothetical protein
MPTIDLTEDEHAAVMAAIRRAIEEDRFPRAPRLDPLRSALAKLDSTMVANPPEAAPPTRGDKRARRYPVTRTARHFAAESVCCRRYRFGACSNDSRCSRGKLVHRVDYRHLWIGHWPTLFVETR